MEYLYIVGIIGYYLYKAYSGSKKKQEENNLPDSGYETSSPPKKKKGLFDEILEEIERAQREQAPKPTPAPQTVVIPEVKKTAPKQQNKPFPKSVPQWETPQMAAHLEGERTTSDNIFSLEGTGKIKRERGFARMKMSPKEALKAQIILERKF